MDAIEAPVKKILYISYDGMTDPLGQSQVLPYLEGLSRLGYRFTILSFEKKERFAREKGTISAIIQRSGISWHPLLFTPSPPVVSKVYDRFQMKRAAVRLHRKNGFDLVHCRSYVAAEAGLYLKKRFGIHMLFDMRGFWADEKVDNGQWDIKRFLFRKIYQHYKAKEREFLLNADGIISLTHAAKKYLLEQAPYGRLEIDVIPCCADLEHFDFNKIDPARTKALKQKLGIMPDSKVICYLGSTGGWYMMKEMLVYFKLLSHQFPEYVMLVMTKDNAAAVKNEAFNYGIEPDKIFVTYAERSELPDYLSLCSSSIFFIRNSFSKTASSPTKHAELMGMGIPVICNDIGDTGWIIRKTHTGSLISSFDEASMRCLINETPGLEKMDRQTIRAYAKEYFDLALGTLKYEATYKRIFSS